MSEHAVATAYLLRASAVVLTGSPVHAHERDMRYWAAEWIVVPQTLILGGGLLQKLVVLLEGVTVDAERMLHNLELSAGAISAEAVMMALAGEVGRGRAHEVVTDAAHAAARSGRDLEEILSEMPEVAGRLSRAEIRRLLDPAAYLGLATASDDAIAAALEGRRRAAAPDGGSDR